jgi:hypothetical protein
VADRHRGAADRGKEDRRRRIEASCSSRDRYFDPHIGWADVGLNDLDGFFFFFFLFNF